MSGYDDFVSGGTISAAELLFRRVMDDNPTAYAAYTAAKRNGLEEVDCLRMACVEMSNAYTELTDRFIRYQMEHVATSFVVAEPEPQT